MKKLSYLLLVLLLPALSFAQTKINASDIIAQINRGEAVSLQNAVIEGDLDLTQLANKKLKKENNGDSHSTHKSFASTVSVPLSFTNCTFRGEVLAYYNPDNPNLSGSNGNMVLHYDSEKGVIRKNETYSANFDQNVRFEKCVFEETAAFKHSEFRGTATFTDCQFQDLASFKHSQFAKAVDFSGSTFVQGVTFKHVSFPEQANFSQTTFRSEADFKHADFSNGVNFQKAVFDGFANFKHTSFARSSNFQGISFKGNGDFKHTSLAGERVTAATLEEKGK
jgi:uncharacterized protein YjbI with pentapeptide repeats